MFHFAISGVLYGPLLLQQLRLSLELIRDAKNGTVPVQCFHSKDVCCFVLNCYNTQLKIKHLAIFFCLPQIDWFPRK